MDTSLIYTCTCAHMCTCTHMHMHMHIHAHAHVHAHVHVHVHAHVSQSKERCQSLKIEQKERWLSRVTTPKGHTCIVPKSIERVIHDDSSSPRRCMHVTDTANSPRRRHHTLPPETPDSHQGLGRRRPHSLAPSSEATSLSLPRTVRALQRVSAAHDARGERQRAHHSSTHSCGETSIPSGAPLASTGRNHGDPPAPWVKTLGGSALALSKR